jgi:hypothetical protein
VKEGGDCKAHEAVIVVGCERFMSAKLAKHVRYQSALKDNASFSNEKSLSNQRCTLHTKSCRRK